jgi:hypothetical protein
MKCECDGDFSKSHRKVIHDINTHGWHVTIVLPAGANPDWAYSIGLFHTFRHPEILVFGLDGDLMHQLINHVGREARVGARIEPGRDYGDIIERYRCAFRPVNASWYPYVLCNGTWFYKGSGFPTLQLFWPDKLQRYPWEPDFEARLLGDQPLLFHAGPGEARANQLLASLSRGPGER